MRVELVIYVEEAGPDIPETAAEETAIEERAKARIASILRRNGIYLIGIETTAEMLSPVFDDDKAEVREWSESRELAETIGY